MKAIYVIAINTFREIIRDRILYGIVVFALFLVGISLALGDISYAETARISADFGFTGIQLASAVLAIFVGSTLVSREIEKQTILTLLARPISRGQFIVGKYLGLSLVVVTVMAGLAAVLACVATYLEVKIDWPFFEALIGILIECLTLMSITLFFGIFSRPMMAVIYACSFFLIGHWVSTMDAMVTPRSTGGFRFVVQLLDYLIPNLERFNWRDAPIYHTAVATADLLGSVCYGLGWIAVLIGATILIFRRRDFV